MNSVSALNQNAPRIPAWSVGTTVVIGCIVLQILTDTYMNGTLAVPNTASAAPSLSEPGPPYFRTKRYPTAISHPTNDIVSRASQTHHTPHAFLAHNGPVTRTIKPNSAVSSAAASATRSAAGSFRQRNKALATPHTTADISM